MGLPGCGKTSLLRALTGKHQKARALTFIADPDGQFEDILPVYRSGAAWAAAQTARRAKGLPMERGASIRSSDTAVLLRFIKKLSEANGPWAYIFVGLDEAVLVTGASAHHVGADIANILGRRRHMGIAMAILCQDLGQLHAQWQYLCTDLYLFRVTAKRRLVTISERLSVDFGALEAAMKALPERYKCLHLRHGQEIRI